MTQFGILTFALLAEGTEGESDCFGFFLAIGLLLLPLVPLFWALKRAIRQSRISVDIAETQIELQREQIELQKRTNVLLEQLIASRDNETE